MNSLKAINTLLITALALGSLGSTAAVAYQVSTATADQAETAVSAFSRESEVAQTRGLRNDEAARLIPSRATAADYAIIVADRTAQWQLDEVRSLKSGLDRIADRLSELTGRDGQRLMKRLFQGVAFYRDRKWRGNIAYTIGGTVSFYDVWAGYDDVGRAFYLAHELGHVLDAHDSPPHLCLGEVSQAVSRNVDAWGRPIHSAIRAIGRGIGRTTLRKTGPSRSPRS